MNLKQLLRIVVATTLVCVVVLIKIPTPIPFTLQTLMVALIGLILSPIEAFLTIMLYLGIGMLGIPVFASGSSFAAFLSPTGGFLMSFPVAALLISIFKTKNRNLFIDALVLFIVLIPLTYLFAIMYYAYQTNTTILKGLSVFLIYMGIDMVKIVIALLVYYRLPQSFLDEVNFKQAIIKKY